VEIQSVSSTIAAAPLVGDSYVIDLVDMLALAAIITAVWIGLLGFGLLHLIGQVIHVSQHLSGQKT
jgi:hypothetical protein